jgi:hypothetical protein
MAGPQVHSWNLAGEVLSTRHVHVMLDEEEMVRLSIIDSTVVTCTLLLPDTRFPVLHANLLSQVLRLLIRLYEECEQPDYVVICQCLMFLDDAPEVAKILNKLLSSGSEVSVQESTLTYSK